MEKKIHSTSINFTTNYQNLLDKYVIKLSENYDFAFHLDKNKSEELNYEYNTRSFTDNEYALIVLVEYGDFLKDNFLEHLQLHIKLGTELNIISHSKGSILDRVILKNVGRYLDVPDGLQEKAALILFSANVQITKLPEVISTVAKKGYLTLLECLLKKYKLQLSAEMIADSAVSILLEMNCFYNVFTAKQLADCLNLLVNFLEDVNVNYKNIHYGKRHHPHKLTNFLTDVCLLSFTEHQFEIVKKLITEKHADPNSIPSNTFKLISVEILDYLFKYSSLNEEIREIIHNIPRYIHYLKSKNDKESEELQIEREKFSF